jgi:hypothetical protein
MKYFDHARLYIQFFQFQKITNLSTKRQRMGAIGLLIACALLLHLNSVVFGQNFQQFTRVDFVLSSTWAADTIQTRQVLNSLSHLSQLNFVNNTFYYSIHFTFQAMLLITCFIAVMH